MRLPVNHAAALSLVCTEIAFGCAQPASAWDRSPVVKEAAAALAKAKVAGYSDALIQRAE